VVAQRSNGGSNRLYGDLAWLWPVISSPEEYQRESKDWRRILKEELGAGRRKVLELGCGGGHFTSRLAPHHDMTAVDLSPRMLAHSRRLNPGVRHHRGDMRNVRLGREFDAVVLHDAAAYLRSDRDVLRTLATARAHLKPGGVVVVAPEWVKGHFPGTSSRQFTAENNGTKVAFFEYEYDSDPKDSTIDSVIVYVIRRGNRVRIEHDMHLTGLFSVAEWRGLFKRSGFALRQVDTRHADEPRQPYLLVGRQNGSRN